MLIILFARAVLLFPLEIFLHQSIFKRMRVNQVVFFNCLFLLKTATTNTENLT